MMVTEHIRNYVGKEELSVVDAMSQIDLNSKGILFIVDDEDRLVGTLTDGDIRRWILSKGDLLSPVSMVMNRTPKRLNSDEEDVAFQYMNENYITAVPIVDSEKKVLNIVFLNEENSDCNNFRNNSLSGIPIIIMAGGKGTRLYPYTKILPKPLIPIGDTPIVERIIGRFLLHGINRFYMTLNYKKGMIKSYFNDLEPDYEIEYIEEDKPLGTAGSIKLIEEKLEEPLFVTNCDALIMADYADIYEHHKNSGNDITMVIALKKFTIPYGVVNTGDNGELLTMEEKPRMSYFINTGMYVINPGVIEFIPDDEVFHMTNLIEKIMNNGGKVGTYPISEDSFLDMGEFDEMKRMEQKLNEISK